MTKLPRSYCDYRTSEEALANTKKAWVAEDTFFANVIEPLGGIKIGGDADRVIGRFSVAPDFQIGNLYIEYQTSRVVTKQLQIKQHKYKNFEKYPNLILVHKMKDYYYLIDNVDHFSIVEGGLRWCGFKPGYQLDADELNKLPKLSEAEVYEEIQTRIRT